MGAEISGVERMSGFVLRGASTSLARTDFGIVPCTPFALSLSKGASTTLTTPKRDAA
jgi:hypothetical protein